MIILEEQRLVYIQMRNLAMNFRNWSDAGKALRWCDSRNSLRGPCAIDTQLDSLKAWCPRRWRKPNAKRNRGYCADTQNPLTRMTSWYKPDLRDTIASRKRQVVMRKVNPLCLCIISTERHFAQYAILFHTDCFYMWRGCRPPSYNTITQMCVCKTIVIWACLSIICSPFCRSHLRQKLTLFQYVLDVMTN